MSAEAALPPAVLAAVRAPFMALDAVPVDPPVIQPLNLLLDLSGEAMRARLFVVQGEGGAEACLRPDFTVPVARAHIAAGGGAGRYVYEGKVFRVAPAGADRADEFLQIGFEAFAASGRDTAADGGAREDAEVAALAWRAACAGGRDDLSMTLGDAGLFGAFVAALDLAPSLAARLVRAFTRPRALKAELARAQTVGDAAAQAPRGPLADLLAAVPEAEAAAVLEQVWAMAGITPAGGRSAAEIAHRLIERDRAERAPPLSPAQADLIGRFLAVDATPEAALSAVDALTREAGGGRQGMDRALAAWRVRLDALRAGGVPGERLRFGAAFGRAFGYYDGALFEVTSAAMGSDRAVAGGGRYDGLPLRLGAQTSGGAVGCMVRPARAFSGGAA